MADEQKHTLFVQVSERAVKSVRFRTIRFFSRERSASFRIGKYAPPCPGSKRSTSGKINSSAETSRSKSPKLKIDGENGYLSTAKKSGNSFGCDIYFTDGDNLKFQHFVRENIVYLFT